MKPTTLVHQGDALISWANCPWLDTLSFEKSFSKASRKDSRTQDLELGRCGFKLCVHELLVMSLQASPSQGHGFLLWHEEILSYSIILLVEVKYKS